MNDLIQLKLDTVKLLKSIDLSKYNLSDIDSRLDEYVVECINNPDMHNLYELLSVKRFLSFIDKYDLRKDKVKEFIVFYEFLEFAGSNGPSRYKLTPIQVFQFSNIMGFYYKDSDKRVIRDALLFVPRKFSKTTSAAALAVYDLLFGDNNAQSYVAANSFNQAQICFREIKHVLRRLDRKMKRFKINREIVYNRSPGKTSLINCLASRPEKLDGLNASTVIVDEYAQAKSADLKNVLDSSMGARKNPLSIVITTASDLQESPFVDMLNYYKEILRGEKENDDVFAHIFEPDVDDEEGDPKTWRKVQPHMNLIVNEDFYHSSWRRAQNNPDDLKEFRNKLINVFTKGDSKKWITKEQIEQLFRKIEEKDLEDVRCVASVDLSVCDDFSAVSYTFYLPNNYWNGEYCPFHSITDYYIPEKTIENHPNRELYKKWASEGYLKVIKGSMIDYNLIANNMLEKPFSIIGVGFDPYKSKEFQKIIELSAGKEYLYPIGQTYGNFTSPVESFEIAVNGKQITFDPNPITSYCFSNAVIDEDRLENRKPIKSSPNNKIDGVVTNVMNFWMMMNVKLII